MMGTKTKQQTLEDHLMIQPTHERGNADQDRTPSTQAEIIRRVSGATEEKLFWLRVDLATEWLTRKYKSEETVKKILPQKEFWWWWLRLWTMTDNQIMSWLDKKGIDTVNWNAYEEQMRETSHEKWIPGKVFPAINVNL